VENAKNTPIHLLDDDSEEARKANAYQCFGYQLSLHQNEYILSSGVWYEVTGDFLARINSDVAAIPTPKLKLPAWNKGETEPEYNARCGQIPGFLSMDVKPVMVGGKQSKLEFCDTLHLQSKTLYFAKIGSKSSGMSHLLEQTRRTEELFFAPGDSSYRKALERVIKTHHKGTPTEWLETKPKNGDWNPLAGKRRNFLFSQNAGWPDCAVNYEGKDTKSHSSQFDSNSGMTNFRLNGSPRTLGFTNSGVGWHCEPQ
jgi:uncharacterized protein (TIGR04141 family)